MALSLGQRIIHHRKKAGLSQKDLAAAVGISPAMLSYYENNKRNPATRTLVKIAEALDITGDRLLGSYAQVFPELGFSKNDSATALSRQSKPPPAALSLMQF